MTYLSERVLDALPPISPSGRLTDRQIKRSSGSGEIIVTGRSFSNDQIQPASLEFTIKSYELLSRDGSLKPPFLTSGSFSPEIILAPGAKARIYVREQIKTTLDYAVDLRSSRGRLALRLDDYLLCSNDRGQYLQITNHNPNAVTLHPGSRFAHIFFETKDESLGRRLTSRKEVRAHAPELINAIKKDGLSLEEVITPSGYFLFRAQEIRPFQKMISSPRIDTLSRDTLPPADAYLGDDLFVRATSSELFPQVNYFVKVGPSLHLSKHIGIQALPYIPSNDSDLSVSLQGIVPVCAGWFDPGFMGPGGSAHISVPHKTAIRKGAPVALGHIYYFPEGVERPYGSKELPSTYQGTYGATCRA